MIGKRGIASLTSKPEKPKQPEKIPRERREPSLHRQNLPERTPFGPARRSSQLYPGTWSPVGHVLMCATGSASAASKRGALAKPVAHNPYE